MNTFLKNDISILNKTLEKLKNGNNILIDEALDWQGI